MSDEYEARWGVILDQIRDVVQKRPWQGPPGPIRLRRAMTNGLGALSQYLAGTLEVEDCEFALEVMADAIERSVDSPAGTYASAEGARVMALACYEVVPALVADGAPSVLNDLLQRIGRALLVVADELGIREGA